MEALPKFNNGQGNCFMTNNYVVCSKAVYTILYKWRTWMNTTERTGTETKKDESSSQPGLTSTHFSVQHWMTPLTSYLVLLTASPWTFERRAWSLLT